MARFGIYCRVSTDHQEDNYSLEAQERECRAYLAAHGHAVSEHHVVHEVFSGAFWFERTRLQSLLIAVRKKEIDGIIAWKLDRVSRNQAHIGAFLTEIERAGATFLLAAENFEDTPEGKLIISINSYVAEREKMNILQRMRLGLLERVRKGLPLGGSAPYGWEIVYDSHGNRVGFRQKPDEVAVLLQIRDLILAGNSLRQVAMRLNALGIAAPTTSREGKAAQWYGTSIKKIIFNPIHTGRPAVSKTKTQHVNGKKKRSGRAPDEYTWIAPVEPIWSQQDVETMRAMVARHRVYAKKPRVNPEGGLLRGGIGKCGYCGHSLAYTARRRERRDGATVDYSIYSCSAVNRTRYGCPAYGMQAKDLDAAVWNAVVAVINDPSEIAQRLKYRNSEQRKNASESLATIDRRLAEIEAEMSHLAADLVGLRNERARAVIRSQIDELADQLDTLARMREEQQGKLAALNHAEPFLLSVGELSRLLTEYKDHVPASIKRKFLMALEADVRLYATNHVPRWELRFRVRPGGEYVSVNNDAYPDNHSQQWLSGYALTLVMNSEEPGTIIIAA